MYDPAGVKTLPEFLVPEQMKAWVLGNQDELLLRDKPTPVPGRAEVLVRIDAVAICATDLEIIHGGSPASIQGGLPFNKNFTPGHEYMGTVAALGPGVDEFEIGERVSVEIHAGCGQCRRCRQDIPPALTTGNRTRVIAPTVSPPMAVSPNTPSITSTRWRGYPTP
jgi:L-iditol 2-dehydrogenase